MEKIVWRPEEGEDKGIYRNHPEWNMTIYYVVHDYNTLELTGFMVITVPLENIKKLLENGYEGTWLALEGKKTAAVFALICRENWIQEKNGRKVSRL